MATLLSKDQVVEKLIPILEKHMDTKLKGTVKKSTALSSINIESFNMMMVVFDIEDTFNIQLPENISSQQMPKTIGGLAGMIVRTSAAEQRLGTSGQSLGE